MIPCIMYVTERIHDHPLTCRQQPTFFLDLRIHPSLRIRWKFITCPQSAQCIRCSRLRNSNKSISPSPNPLPLILKQHARRLNRLINIASSIQHSNTSTVPRKPLVQTLPVNIIPKLRQRDILKQHDIAAPQPAQGSPHVVFGLVLAFLGDDPEAYGEARARIVADHDFDDVHFAVAFAQLHRSGRGDGNDAGDDVDGGCLRLDAEEVLGCGNAAEVCDGAGEVEG